MKKLTVKGINKALLELMNEKPDFVYNDPEADDSICNYSCGPNYNKDLCTGCIFGQAFVKLGIPHKVLKKLELDGAGVGIEELSDYVDFLPKRIPAYFQEIQDAQDQGVPWGKLKRHIPNR